MAEAIALDTSAILTLTGGEPRADDVRGLLTQGIAGQIQLYGSFVTLTEVEYITLQEEGNETARQRMTDLMVLPIHWLHSDTGLCREAARLKAAYRVSFADAFVAATALRFEAMLVHKDPQFNALAPELKQRSLPPKSGSSQQ